MFHYFVLTHQHKYFNMILLLFMQLSDKTVYELKMIDYEDF